MDRQFREVAITLVVVRFRREVSIMFGKFSRRSFLQSAALSSLAGATPRGWHPSIIKSLVEAPAGSGLPQFVDVFIGTGGHGTLILERRYVRMCSSVLIRGTAIGPLFGISHRRHLHHGLQSHHLSGTGASDLLDVLVMPAIGRSYGAGRATIRLPATDRDFHTPTNMPNPAITRSY